MGWFAALLIIAILIAFNAFAADTMVRLKHDVKDIHKAVLVLTDKVQQQLQQQQQQRPDGQAPLATPLVATPAAAASGKTTTTMATPPKAT